MGGTPVTGVFTATEWRSSGAAERLSSGAAERLNSEATGVFTVLGDCDDPRRAAGRQASRTTYLMAWIKCGPLPPYGRPSPWRALGSVDRS
ncbi:hypothetical protein SSPO_045460 [Streptomyces antimycoticus]|uniref:Uncharacterized protein n=1 Tax=Streptomyces antimycoticus TaxID=68175 RepID=A0A499UPK9_9ACTN|nr:hypothetical protein SSPO_045460 [Streptomyces antimycoticus]